MAYAEKRGRGPASWRVRYKCPDGTWATESGFETKKAALVWGREQEAQVRRGLWADPEAGEITVDDWIKQWLSVQDVGISTMDTREYLIRRFIRPKWGLRKLNSLAVEEIAAWERGLPAEEHVSIRTAKDARSLLCTILGDAVAARPPLILYNPALRPRNRGRKTGKRIVISPPRAWATPLEALLIAERAALLSGQDDDFTMVITIAYTGIRWGEAIGLEGEFILPELINLEWQLREINGKFYRLPPKDDSYRSTNWEPGIPIDLPPFLGTLLASAPSGGRCRCERLHDGSARYRFTGPDGGHYRRSDYARRVFRPACDGRYPSEKGKPGRLVVVDTATWPGQPVAAWPPVVGGMPFEPPSGRGNAKLINGNDSGRCPTCGRSFPRRTDGGLITHKSRSEPCPGSGGPPLEDPALAVWLPIKPKLTPHGLRHSHKTWMIEDGVPEILAEIRLGHDVPGMRGLYSHVSNRMRDELKEALQARWDESLRARAVFAPTSAVPTLDKLLTPIREGDRRGPCSQGNRTPPASPCRWITPGLSG